MRLNIIILYILICILYFPLKSQTFSGKLIYKFSVDSSIILKDSLLARFAQVFEIPNNCLTTILIKKNRLYSTTKTLDNRIMFYEYQNRDTTYLIGEGRKKKERISNNMYVVKKPLNKSDDFKFILGFKCKKYTYEDTNNPEQTFVAWIPDNLQFKGQAKNGKFFSEYFFPDGLAFRFEMIYKGIVSIRELIRIDMYDVLDSEFDIEEDKK
jgi:hypothetical protein